MHPNFDVLYSKSRPFRQLYFKSDSDALIAKGLVTLIASIYSDEAPKDIVNSEIDLMEEFELGVII